MLQKLRGRNGQTQEGSRQSTTAKQQVNDADSKSNNAKAKYDF